MFGMQILDIVYILSFLMCFIVVLFENKADSKYRDRQDYSTYDEKEYLIECRKMQHELEDIDEKTSF